MNRCEVCDKTDDDDPKAAIALYDGELRCKQCQEVIAENLEDLSVNDESPIDYLDTFLLPSTIEDDHWIEAPLPEVSE